MNVFDALATNPAFNEAMLPLLMSNASQGSDCEKVEKAVEPVPPMPPRGLAFGCQGCHCHDFEAGIHWCWNGKARSYRNIVFLKVCPLR